MAMRRTRGQTRSFKQQATQAEAAAVERVPLALKREAVTRTTRASVKQEIEAKEAALKVTGVKTEPQPAAAAAADNDGDESEEEEEAVADGMTEYERKRLENIQRNLDFMRSMGVSTAKAAARIAVGGASVKGHVAAKGVQPKRRAAEPAAPMRKSRRIQGQQTDLVALGEGGAIPAHYADIRPAAQPERVRRFDAKLVAEAVNLSGDRGKALLSSIAGGLEDEEEEERESDLVVDAAGVDTVNFTLRSDDIVKAVEERVYAVAFHPRTDKLVVAAGDKRGNLSLWRADEVRADDDEAVVAMYRPHTSPVTQLHFAPHDATKLLSASYDGSVREFDLVAASFAELFGTSDDVGITSMAVDKDHRELLVSCEDGRVWAVDPRQQPAKQTSYLLHEKKVNTVHRHPMFPFCLATASLDRTVCLWDARKLKKSSNTPLVTMPHNRSVNCAYFSPGGEHLVTVGQDNFVNLFDTRDETHKDAHRVQPTLAIPHDNMTGRWLTKLHAAWDPKCKDRFVIGCMQQPRRIQIFQAARKNPIQELRSEFFNSVHSINVFHPSLDVIAGGNSSGRLALWRGTPHS